MIYACTPLFAEEGTIAPAAIALSPIARDYPSRAFDGFFMPPRCDCSIKERGEVAAGRVGSPPVLTTKLLTCTRGE